MAKKNRVIAVFLALVVMAVAVTAWITEGFKNWNPYGWFDKKDDTTVTDPIEDDETFKGGMLIDDEATDETALSLRQYRISPLSYATYAVPKSAESAYVLIATVGPENNGDNTNVSWDMHFVDDTSEWAQGKTVTEYVSLEVSQDTCKQAVVTCLKPFGTKIEIKITSNSYPDVFTTRTVNYVQRVSDVALSFGETSCNFGGETNVVVELAETGTPKGGSANLNVIFEQTPYTLPAEYEVSYAMDFARDSEGAPATFIRTGGQFGYTYYDIVSSDDGNFPLYSVAEKGLYFGLKYFVDNFGAHYYNTGVGGSIISLGKYYTPGCDVATFIYAYDNAVNKTNSYSGTLQLFNLTVTLSGKYVSMSKTTTFKMSGYTNAPRVEDVTVSGGNDGDGNIVF